MAPHSSVLAWRIPRTEEPGGLPSTGSHRVRHDWSDLAAATDIKRLFAVCFLSLLFSQNFSVLVSQWKIGEDGIGVGCDRKCGTVSLVWFWRFAAPKIPPNLSTQAWGCIANILCLCLIYFNPITKNIPLTSCKECQREQKIWVFVLLLCHRVSEELVKISQPLVPSFLIKVMALECILN